MKRLVDRQQTRMMVVSAGFKEADAEKWYKKWTTIIRNARHYSYCNDCKLSLTDYLSLAKEAGLTSPEQIGPRLGTYQLGRLGDTGDYEIGNCRFILREQNIEEWKVNGGLEVMRRKKTGRTKDTCPGLQAWLKRCLALKNESSV